MTISRSSSSAGSVFRRASASRGPPRRRPPQAVVRAGAGGGRGPSRPAPSISAKYSSIWQTAFSRRSSSSRRAPGAPVGLRRAALPVDGVAGALTRKDCQVSGRGPPGVEASWAGPLRWRQFPALAATAFLSRTALEAQETSGPEPHPAISKSEEIRKASSTATPLLGYEVKVFEDILEVVRDLNFLEPDHVVMDIDELARKWKVAAQACGWPRRKSRSSCWSGPVISLDRDQLLPLGFPGSSSSLSCASSI